MPSAIVVRKIDGKPGQVYYPLEKVTVAAPSPKSDEVVIAIRAAALNHRDLFIRQHLYPGVSFGVPLLADGSGVVVSTGSDPAAKAWQGKRVVINPGSGWASDPYGPEDPAGYKILGGTKFNPVGTLAEYAVIAASEVEEAPAHLSDGEAAAVVLTGLTAWRAVFSKSGNAEPGRNILVTGIGGGVAIMALLLAHAAGVRVFVTSGSAEKLEKAKELGAAGGVNYKDKDWEKQLQALLPKDRPYLDAVVDGAGGDIVPKSTRLLKAGGVIVTYGMTVGPQIVYPMGTVLKNIDLKGSTMGSRKEFADMIKFVQEKQLRPVISRSVRGLDIEAIDGLFEDMKKGTQFGKLVVEVSSDGQASKL
ncbi:NAD(P)-binding protein [Trichodelitschia bisporula]|uniref:NAD(P)-binding protein n=1 Tax=Trichodelitschia bisporula TaxID=703511 RepID=A0A6G1I110_9PEZI|nr:NAD(P)-binding protein [Trichodelitschia bisporula]